MQQATETLQLGSKPPLFTLKAANREGSFTLAELNENKPLVLEFLRGTW